jgi:hypothetical protein
MDYKKAYKLLKRNGIIDMIIKDESNRGEVLPCVKHEIIEGIEYFLTFIKESSFKTMKYRWHNAENIHQRVTQKICAELAKLRLAEINNNHVRYEYMLKALPKESS